MAAKSERLLEFLQRLIEAPPASTAQEALELVNEVLNEMEDRLSGIPYDPHADRQVAKDGRMYGPHPSYASSWRAGVTRYAHTRHDTFIQDNGAILIRLRGTKTVLLSKPGADGKDVEP